MPLAWQREGSLASEMQLPILGSGVAAKPLHIVVIAEVQQVSSECMGAVCLIRYVLPFKQFMDCMVPAQREPQQQE